MDIFFKIDSTESFTQVMEDVLNNLYNSNHIPADKSFDISSIKTAKEEIKKYIMETNLNTNDLTVLLSAKCPHNEERVRIVISQLEKRKSELLHLMLVHYNCAFGETLHNYDWKLKYVHGTSELKTLSYPLLQLALYTITVNHKPAQRLYEVNKDTLIRLIGILEECVVMNEVI